MTRLPLAAALGRLATVSAVFAESPPAPVGDYYQNLLMGTLCKDKVDLGLTIGGDQLDIKNSFGD